MRGSTDVPALFFDSGGRAGRRAFVLKIAAVAAMLAVYDRLAIREVRLLTGWLVEWPLFFSAACILCQRLHDCGRSGWWGAPILAAFCLAWPQPHGALGDVGLAFTLVSCAWLSLTPGQALFNRYGPRP